MKHNRRFGFHGPRICWLLLAALSVSVSGAAEHNRATPHNVIVLIADGCGFNHLRATGHYRDGEPGQERYQQTFTALSMSTCPAGGEYDPATIHAEQDACKEGATDSAAAATAMATGVKTSNGAIGVDTEGNPIANVVEAAEGSGKATGVITTVPFSHATPAGFVAHAKSRNSYAEIARQMLRESAVDVVMGAGHPLFDDDGKRVAEDWDEGQKAERYQQVGGFETWQALQSGEPMGDADGDGTPDPWTLVETRRGVQQLGRAAPKRVVAVLPVHGTTQARRTGVDGDFRDDEPYETPRLMSVPSLAEMTRGALAVLEQDADGFFLMVEGGAVDWASHDNALGRMIEEQTDFNRAVDAAIDWVQSNGGWDRNLVVVTSDHECGYLCGPDSTTTCTPVRGRGKSRMPEAEWRSGGHTNQLVPFYARGAGTPRFVDRATRKDPVHGAYLDNTDLGEILLEILKTDP